MYSLKWPIELEINKKNTNCRNKKINKKKEEDEKEVTTKRSVSIESSETG